MKANSEESAESCLVQTAVKRQGTGEDSDAAEAIVAWSGCEAIEWRARELRWSPD